MTRSVLRSGAAIGLALLSLSACRRSEGPLTDPVVVRAGLDHSAWERLLRDYVDGKGLVAYERWKGNPDDLAALRRYLAALSAPATPPAAGDDLVASLLNGYNALTIAWVLENYPTDSIRALKDPFRARRHTVGGRRVSLDDIEHGALRPLAGYRVHGALVCAARSCPPLRREAYTASRLDGQLDRAMREWLDREDLNRFDVAGRRAEISPIFKWYAEDFEKVGGLRSALKTHSRGDVPRLLDGEDVKIRYVRYHWGLNDKDGRGESYGGFRALRDTIRRAF
ncbi:MAG: DUF547 domain-containing protein [Thermoanaerobaculia bacterium]